MENLFFKIKAVPSKENYTIEDMNSITRTRINEWIEDANQKVPGVTPVTNSVEYTPNPELLDTLVEAVVYQIRLFIDKVYIMPLGYYPTIFLYKLVEEEDESKVIGIVGYAIALDNCKRNK